MKKIIAIAMVVVLALTAVVGTTFAYFTDEDSDVNVMTVGNVKIELVEEQRDEAGNLEPFEDDKELMPMPGSAQAEKDKWGLPTADNYVDKIVRVKNTGNNPAYVRVIIAVPAALEGETANENALHWNFGNRFDAAGTSAYNEESNPAFNTDLKYEQQDSTAVIDGITYNLYTFTYQNAVEPGYTTTIPAMIGMYLDSNVEYDDTSDTYSINGKIIDYDLSEKVYIPVYAQAIQKAGFDTADAAFAASGMADNPWANTSNSTSTAELNESLAAGKDVVLTASIEDTEIVKMANGGTLDGNGNTITKSYSGEGTNAAIQTSGGIITNLTVANGNTEAAKGLRAVYVTGSLTEDVVVNNCVLDGTYAINVNSGADNSGYSLRVTDTVLNGWTSYSSVKSATFTDCSFGTGSTGHAHLRPYVDTTLTGCSFAEGFTIGMDKNDTTAHTITLNNCTYNGDAITAANFIDLLQDVNGGDYALKSDVVTIIVDGVEVAY